MLYYTIVLYHATTGHGELSTVRALVNLIVATLMLLNAPLATTPGTSFTTTVSGVVAPYLPLPTPYVRPHVAQLVHTHRQHIIHVAHTYNQPALSGLTDVEFASILIMILYTEHHGWLEDVVPSVRALTPLYQDLQVLSNHHLGTNFSVWPANLRPSVIDEIRAEQYISVPSTFTVSRNDPSSNNDLATNPATAIELLAANMARGVQRAHDAGIQVTTASILAWHNAGIVEPRRIAANRSVQHYINRALIYHALAQLDAHDGVACQQSAPHSSY